jgi:digeranylgeranylglycerophospholipid reductase
VKSALRYTTQLASRPSSTAPPIAVVGGSAAGFYAACLLAQGGRGVRVFEQNERLAPAERTLIVTRRMRDLLGPLGELAVLNEIRRFEIWSDGRSAQVSLRHPDLIIERARLIHALAEQARAAGAEVVLGARFIGLGLDGARRTLEMERGGGRRRENVPATVVIGADGALSRVARAAGWPAQKTAPLLQAVVRLPADFPRDCVRVWFIPEDTPYFYWLIPETKDRGVLGLIGEDGDQAKRGLERFLDRRGFEPLEYQGARIPLYTGWVPVHRRIGDADVYLVGDAASQVKVTTVGGIVTGLRGARAVARAILEGDGGPELRSLRRELNLHLLVRRSLHGFSQQQYSRVLGLLNAAAYRSLANFHRDEVARMLWRLCQNQPRLLWMGLRGLLADNGFPSNGRRD